MLALHQNVRLLLAGRDTPSGSQRDLGDLLRTIRLGNLDDDASRSLLRCAGVDGAVAGRVARVGRGHPSRLSWPPGRWPSGRGCRPGTPSWDRWSTNWHASTSMDSMR